MVRSGCSAHGPCGMARSTPERSMARSKQNASALQECADVLTKAGVWERLPHGNSSVSWLWRVSPPGPSCKLRDDRLALTNRWVLFIGDSRLRLVYAALLSSLNRSRSLQLGWPTHRVPDGDPCTPYTPRPNGRADWGWYNPRCQLRWKGPCWDDGRGRNTRDTCTLDYTFASLATRITFQWHSLNHPRHLYMLVRKVGLLCDGAGRLPDAVVASTGTWDLTQLASTADRRDACPRVDAFARALFGGAPPLSDAAGAAAASRVRVRDGLPTSIPAASPLAEVPLKVRRSPAPRALSGHLLWALAWLR